MPDERVEKVARAIYEARGAHEPPRAWRKWEDIGGEAQAVWGRCAEAALSAASAEPVATEAAIRADERAAKALDLIAKMAGNVVFNGKQHPISHEDHMRAWADIEATAIRARGPIGIEGNPASPPNIEQDPSRRHR